MAQQRGRDKRERLLAAAIGLLADGGPRAITHRAVAAAAGVPLAATTYYFASIQELIDEALALHVSRRAEEIRSLVDGALLEGRSPMEVRDLLVASLLDRASDAVAAQFEVYLEAWRNEALRAPVRSALDAFEAMTVEALRSLGVASPEVHAAGFMAAVDGFALHRLARPRPRLEELAALEVALRSLFIGASMSSAEVAAWDERLAAVDGTGRR